MIVRGKKRPTGSKLKKKIVYVYDSDSDDGNYKKPVAGRPTIQSPPEVSQPPQFFASTNAGFQKYMAAKSQGPQGMPQMNNPAPA